MTESMFRILVVEDDPDIRKLLQTLLEADGHRVVLAEDAARGMAVVRGHKPDAMIVDLGLPDRDGQALIRDVRAFSSVPILVLSARTVDVQKIAALDTGADDYITKPFGAGELLARVRAALRRGANVGDRPPVLRFGPVTIELDRRVATGPAGTLHLTPIEFRLLACLARSPGLVVTRELLIREVWGPDRMTDTRGLRSYVKQLRQKLELDPSRPRHLMTEPGVGYRLIPDLAPDHAGESTL